MNKGLKLVYTSAALLAFSALALQGCGSDSDDTAPPAAGSAGTSGGSSGNGGSSGKGGTAGASGSSSGNGGSSGSTAGNGGSSGSSGSGGQAGGGSGGEAGATAVQDCSDTTYFKTGIPYTCQDLCDSWVSICKGLAGIPAADANKYADVDACLADCATLSHNAFCCRDEHVHNTPPTTHCPHAVGDGLCQN